MFYSIFPDPDHLRPPKSSSGSGQVLWRGQAQSAGAGLYTARERRGGGGEERVELKLNIHSINPL